MMEPTLPIWMMETMCARKWQLGTRLFRSENTLTSCRQHLPHLYRTEEPQSCHNTHKHKELITTELDTLTNINCLYLPSDLVSLQPEQI